MQNLIVLTHGAGSNRDAPLLVALDSELTQARWRVARVNLAFREARSTGPPFPAEAARDREVLRQAVENARQTGGLRVYLGGHSYGGRQCSMLAAESPELVCGLLLLSYPLHPPGRPERARTSHLPGLRTPCLFVHGTRDPFGTLEELQSAMALIAARTSLLPVDGAGHGLAAHRGAKLHQIAARIAQAWIDFAEGEETATGPST